MPKLAQGLLDEFGLAVKLARSARGWKIKDVANRIAKMEGGQSGTTSNPPAVSFLSDIEKGKRSISLPTVGKLIHALELSRDWLQRFQSASTGVADETVPADAEADALIQLADQDRTAPQTGEDLLIALAQEFAPHSGGDLHLAYGNLRAALESAENIRQRGKMPSNLDDQIKATLTEVARLTADNQRPEAKALLDRELARLADEVAERDQARAALMQSGVDVARTLNDPQAAANYELARLHLDAPADPFAALRALRDEWDARGRDKGLAFDLDVSIALAETCVMRAQTADQRGMALNDLGVALQTLGEREPGTARLEQAVAAYTEALKERTRDRVPLDWAMTQMNLGCVLAIFGAREPGTARLEAAVLAFTEALEVWTRDSVPLDWATAKNNLGNTQALLGTRETGTARLEHAVAAYTESLKERTRDRVPLNWARTQMNLGNALQTLGAREAGTARLEGAVAAYTEALKEWTRDRVPLDWAMTQGNLANVEVAYFDKTADHGRLANARAHLEAAREIFIAADAGHYVGMADAQLARITAREGS